MDKPPKALHEMTRSDAIEALLNAQQTIKDLEGAMEVLTAVQEVPNEERQRQWQRTRPARPET